MKLKTKPRMTESGIKLYPVKVAVNDANGHYAKRKKVTEDIEFRIALLGRYGFSTKAIIKSLDNHKAVRLCSGTVGKYLRLNGVHLWDFRNGDNPDGEERMRELMRKRR